ncbi:Ovate protein family [Macleaya cordata]|uniref:Ovate protein family n=1 Tax=Macleaya cordata TaxID=56857 RepID=A0A200RBH0_MACCD|nr:Ovate protein family [Macleaya cordata]
MPSSKEISSLKKKYCSPFCCSCRYSVSSLDDPGDGSNYSEQAGGPISSIAHAMVQERLDQMIRERMVVDSRNEGRKKKNKNNKRRVDDTKCIIMVAMDKYSYNPREDFRESMIEVIMANRIEEAKDLPIDAHRRTFTAGGRSVKPRRPQAPPLTAIFYVRVLSGYEERRIRSFRLQLQKRLEEANERKASLRKIPEQAILSEVRRMVEEMQTLNKKLEETEAAIEEYFKPIDKEAEMIVNMQLEGEENKMKRMVKAMQEQALLENAAKEKMAEVSSVEAADQHKHEKESNKPTNQV